jgi:uncharacterized damage-inducible protein DinB
VIGFPELAAGERATLEQFLDFHRRCVLEAIDGVSDVEAAASPLPATSLTIGGIVKHLARMEDIWFQRKLRGAPMPEPWASAPWDTDPDWDFHSSCHDSVSDIRALYAAACERSRSTAAGAPDLQQLAAQPSFGKGLVSLRWIFVHMIEETAHHRGHLDLLRDALRHEEPTPGPT